MSHSHHAIDYIEFNVSDMEEAKRFYASAFGWEFTAYGPDYAGISDPSGRGEVGGLNASAEVRPGGPLVILYSEDLEASLASLKQAGATITKEPFDFPGGRRLHFRDPSGNELGVWALPASEA